MPLIRYSLLVLVLILNCAIAAHADPMPSPGPASSFTANASIGNPSFRIGADHSAAPALTELAPFASSTSSASAAVDPRRSASAYLLLALFPIAYALRRQRHPVLYLD